MSRGLCSLVRDLRLSISGQRHEYHRASPDGGRSLRPCLPLSVYVVLYLPAGEAFLDKQSLKLSVVALGIAGEAGSSTMLLQSPRAFSNSIQTTKHSHTVYGTVQITSLFDTWTAASRSEMDSRPSIFRLESTDEENKARVRAIMAGLPNPEATPFKPDATDAEREKAAGTIQKNYRGHRTRRQLRGFGLDPQTRWIEAVKDAQYQRLTTPQAPIRQTETDSTNTAQSPGRSKWTRAAKIAQRAGADDDSIPETSDLSDSQPESTLENMTPEQRAQRKERRDAAKAARKRSAKMMDLQYFLEMVDQKHRYGSHLRKYHAHWKTLDTDQSFFYWLDHGDGLHMDMPECSRKKLDAEQVRYLSREERLNYMVKIDEKGLLRWAKNGELVWTKDELYKDSIKGIVRTDEKIPEYKYNIPPPGAESSSDGDSSNDEGEGEGKADDSLATKDNDDDDRYVNEDFHRARGPAKLKHVSAAVLFNHMIRTSMKKGHKWIFVAGKPSDQISVFYFPVHSLTSIRHILQPLHRLQAIRRLPAQQLHARVAHNRRRRHQSEARAAPLIGAVVRTLQTASGELQDFRAESGGGRV